ncbi:MAG: adenosylcobalamin-dependent ribonucleoside-diphosphate reductase [Magnetospiraceae bacterium]
MPQLAPISQQIWDMKYRFKRHDGTPVDKTLAESWRRVARSLAAAESDPAAWENRFYDALEDFKFLPAGRILSGAGTDRSVTLFNCFVMGDIPDDMSGIFEGLKEAALTMQKGGGIGYDFSTLRPKGAPVIGVGADASGPLSFMEVWDAMCRTIMSAGSRRGAMMGVMRCDHPDIEAFIEAKREPGRLRMFNLSVLVTDDFMAAVKEDGPWELSFNGTTYRSVRARDLWDKIMHGTYDYAEPGVIFIDRINALNNLWYCETIHATNPCGEQPLPPYGTCLLGSINLARLVDQAFTEDADIDETRLADLVSVAVRMLDNVIEVSDYPLPQQKHEAQTKRRIGLGITGLADALILCGARYGGKKSIQLADRWMHVIRDAAYGASAALAQEKGAFPLYDAEKYLAGAFVKSLDQETRAAIADHGIRNSHLVSIAPTGTISLLADNVSSGLEPVFSFSYSRSVLMPDGTRKEEEVSDFAYRSYRTTHGQGDLPDYFVDAQQLSPGDHLVMQAKVQEYVDSSISKTINVPESIAFDSFKNIYLEAYELGCKGCTTYRPNDITGSVLSVKPEKSQQSGPESQEELPLVMPNANHPPAPIPADGDEGAKVHRLTQPLDRPEVLPGATYKVRWPESEHAIYITLNDIVQDGRRRPFEVFINSKDMEHYAWTVALTRMISAVFRRGGDVSFVVEELKAVFDPRGGHWMGGRYVPSLLAAIGDVIEKHMITIGFLSAPGTLAEDAPDVTRQVVNMPLASDPEPATPPRTDSRFKHCPKCQQPSLIRQEGCNSCASCGYSKCG